MSNEQLKDWRGWIITAEQIEAIKAHDREAINKFYFDNYNHLYGMAFNYVYKRRVLHKQYAYEVEDVIQSLYVDMPNLVFNKGAAYFVKSMYHDSFARAPFGGKACCNTRIYENNNKLNTLSIFDEKSEGFLLLETLTSNNVDYYDLENFNERKILEFIKPYLTAREFSALEQFVDGYSYTHIASSVGGKGELSQLLNNVRYKLYQNWESLINYLISLDLNGLEKYRDIKPAIYFDVVEREQKRRRRRAEAERARREKRKALELQRVFEGV